MKVWLKVVAAAVLALAGNVAWAAAPDIPLKAIDGQTRNVNEFIGHGKWTVVVVWAHDCHVCKREIHEMSAFHSAHQAKDAQVLGVTIDGYDQVKLSKEFIAKQKLTFPSLVAEPSQEVLKKFGAGAFIGTPTYYIYNPQGDIVGQNVGPVTREEVEAFIQQPDKPVDEAK